MGSGDRPHRMLFIIHVQIYPLTSPFLNSPLVTQPNHTHHPPETLPLLQIMVGNVQGILDMFSAALKYSWNCSNLKSAENARLYLGTDLRTQLGYIRGRHPHTYFSEGARPNMGEKTYT